jgi:hypothetical protein
MRRKDKNVRRKKRESKKKICRRWRCRNRRGGDDDDELEEGKTKNTSFYPSVRPSRSRYHRSNQFNW